MVRGAVLVVVAADPVGHDAAAGRTEHALAGQEGGGGGGGTQFDGSGGVPVLLRVAAGLGLRLEQVQRQHQHQEEKGCSGKPHRSDRT